VLAGIPPLHLLIEKRTILHCYKKGISPIPWNCLGPIKLENKSITEIKALPDEEVGKLWQQLWNDECSEDK